VRALKPGRIEIKAEGNGAGIRVDSYIASKLDFLSRSHVQRMIDQGMVKVNGKNVKRNYLVKEGDLIVADVLEPKKPEVLPQDIPIDIVYEDSHLMVVNKPAGMVVHPAPGNYSNTLVNALLAYCDDLSGINGVYRPGIVHRIDKDTTGLLVVAKNENAHRGLAAQLKDHSITRRYVALVEGVLNEDKGIIDAPIGRNPADRKKMAVVQRNSKNAITRFKVIKRYTGYTLIELMLETGRTHQIRVHMAYIGHPVVGDPEYGKKGELGATGQLLHAAALGFIHPVKGEYMVFEAPLPDAFQSIIDNLE
jgi:23S rRNA pseudouridine1911/1915/1917 synthase